MKKISNKKAFSLIELMVVIGTIIAIIGFASVNICSQRVVSNQNAAQRHLESIYAAMQAYATLNQGQYPTVTSGGCYTFTQIVNILEQGNSPLLSGRYPWKSDTAANALDGYKFDYACQSAGTNPEFTFTAESTPCNESCSGGRRDYTMRADGAGRIDSANCVVPVAVTPSCPLIFAFNGEKFQLVSDILPSGFLSHPNILGMRKKEIDPDEYLKIDTLTADKDKLLQLRVVEVLDEVSFIDQIKLLAIDHPADIKILPNEYPTTYKPFPEFKIFQYQELLPVKKAYNNKGVDLTDCVKENDGIYIPTKKTKTKGFVEPYSFILDLGDLQQAKQIQLIINISVLFPDSSLYKNFIKAFFFMPDLPIIEVPDGKGAWREAKLKGSKHPMVALYGGDFVNKDQVFDLTGQFKNNDYRIRITSNMDISYDSFKINTFSDYKPININEIKPQNADLSFYGRIEKTYLKLKGQVPYYNYYNLDSSKIVRRLEGQYTRYGDVAKLTTDIDDKFIIMTTGDQISVKFNENELPELPPGSKRTYLLYVDGYFKEIGSSGCACSRGKVEPLPFKAMTGYPYPKKELYPNDKEHLDYQKEYNTRQVN